MEIHENFSFSDFDIDPLTDFNDFDSEVLFGVKKGYEYLSNVDYSLNSPLIRDEIIEFQKYLMGRAYRKSWNVKVWEKRRSAIRKLNVNSESLKTPDELHVWWGRKNLYGRVYASKFKSLLDISQTDSNQTFDIIQSFILGWLNRTVTNPVKNNCPSQILRWGAYFLDLHIVTLCLNAIDDKERSELIKLKGIKYLHPDFTSDLIYSSDNFGKILITHGFIVLVEEKVLLDRNTLLMLKDTYIARFQTLFSMVNRVDETFLNQDWEILQEIYLLGDKIMSLVGNDVYDGLKMIEPIASMRLADLARRHRPLIPRFLDFPHHIELTMEELLLKGIDIRPIFDKIVQLNNPDLVLAIFGSFRHWGHPYINYLDGLENVYQQVNMVKDIDEEYSETLASDLAFIVLSHKFNESKHWFVDAAQLNNDHPLFEHISTNTWPTPKQIQDFGHNWHNLPLLPCFDIPDVIDPSLIYSDKSHSMNKKQVLKHIETNYNTPIPSKKVLQTFLNNPSTNWKEFLHEVNDNGLDDDDLVIGLKAKERELKINGRFFSLMSWKLREYFVVTEYLIKTHFVPLFHGLTMADDLNTVVKKLMDNTTGQGLDNYDNICIANHIDYTRWNNHQRDEGNKPVFEVMGKFLGYPNLISRTHEFFQKSLVYYNNRPDLMRVIDGRAENKTDRRVLWNGQLGGLEGLRQKGWSVVNLLVIRRESINRNTKVKILAQGDNQVICTQYKLQKSRNLAGLQMCLDNILQNNRQIMESIKEGTNKLGLIINKDETLQSADFLIYGKVPIYRGNLKGIESKRWSRVTCVTNDQLPTLSNTLSTINSNALTVSHFSDSPLNSMIHYNFIGNFARNLVEIHNPALKGAPKHLIKEKEGLSTREYKALALYLDPCLGGACGMSLTRFLIRTFPDPVTESLVFWKTLYLNGTPWVKKLAISAGNPKLGVANLQAFKRLMEDPQSLNIPGGVNPLTLIKEEIRSSLIQRSREIRNEIVRSSVEYLKDQEDRLVNFLQSISPLFPRFLSEYLSGTYLGIVRSLVGLFQNSKTIRNVFSRKVDSKVKAIIISSEIQTLSNLIYIGKRKLCVSIWDCSSEKADLLRRASWGQIVIGATVPHPLELIGNTIDQSSACSSCRLPPPYSFYIATILPRGLYNYKNRRGPYKAYLGSKTSETTSILQPWEKDTKVPLIKRAVRLRNSIGWFIEPNSRLADSILQNLFALTGEDWDIQVAGFKRTGSALHRFSCSRQSAAGYSARSPSKLTWMCSTTDTLSALNGVNHDFMHQTLLLYAQTTIAELMDGCQEQGYYHNHISCRKCLRPIEDVILDTKMEFQHHNVFHRIEKWKPDTTPWSESRKVRDIPEGRWSTLTPICQSFHIGRAEGFLFGDMLLSGCFRTFETSLFPLTIQNKVIPREYLLGLLNGLIRASGIHCISRRAISELKRPKEALFGLALYLIDQLSDTTNVIALWRYSGFESLFYSVPHKIPASYPLSNRDLGELGRNYLRLLYRTHYIDKLDDFRLSRNQIWIFSDINESSITGLLSISGGILRLLYKDEVGKQTKNMIRAYKDQIIFLKDPSHTSPVPLSCKETMLRTNQELRHACKEIIPLSTIQYKVASKWKKEAVFGISAISVDYIGKDQNEGPIQIDNKILRLQNPLISGLRLFQFATGSHYKIRSILHHLEINFCDAVVCGDGSGGISSALLRLNSLCQVIFNSLLVLAEVELRGSTPSPPSAIYALPNHRDRCVNLADAWEHSNDLSVKGTWEYLMAEKMRHDLRVDLLIIDAEPSDPAIRKKIEHFLSDYVFKILESGGTLIYKTYLSSLEINSSNVLYTVGAQFEEVKTVWTDITSSQSSEVYICCSRQRKDNLDLKPSLNSIKEIFSSNPANRSLKLEFDRACNIPTEHMFDGVPAQFIPDKFSELADSLEILGVETGVIALMSELIKVTQTKHLYDLAHSIFLISLNSLLHFTALSEGRKNPPTDARVYNSGILIVGFFQWISLIDKNLYYHYLAQDFISKGFLFSWKDNIVKRKNKIYYKQIYSITGMYKNTKNVFLDSYMKRVGALIRSFIRVFEGCEPKALSLGTIDDYMKEFNANLQMQWIKKSIDIFQLMNNEKRVNRSDQRTSIMYDNTSLSEGAFTS